MTGHEAVCLTCENDPPRSCRADAGLDHLNGIGAGGQHLSGKSTRIKRDRRQYFIQLGAAEIAGGCGRLRRSCRRRGGGPPPVASAASAISGAAAGAAESRRTMGRRWYAGPLRSRLVILGPRVPPEPCCKAPSGVRPLDRPDCQLAIPEAGRAKTGYHSPVEVRMSRVACPVRAGASVSVHTGYVWECAK
jgi:hypothetical protein